MAGTPKGTNLDDKTNHPDAGSYNATLTDYDWAEDHNDLAATGNYAYNGLNNTNVGKTGNQGSKTYSSQANWANAPVGVSTMINTASTGKPVSDWGYFTKMANRDTSGGWAGIWISHTGGDLFAGKADSSSVYATWKHLLDTADMTSHVASGSAHHTKTTSLAASAITAGTFGAGSYVVTGNITANVRHYSFAGNGFQHLMGWNGFSNYKHGIYTIHSSSTYASNAILFYVWKPGTDATGGDPSVAIMRMGGTYLTSYVNHDFDDGIDVTGAAQFFGDAIIDKTTAKLTVNTPTAGSTDPRIHLTTGKFTNEGLFMWYDGSVGTTYIDTIYSSSAGDCYIRTKGVSGTMVYITNDSNDSNFRVNTYNNITTVRSTSTSYVFDVGGSIHWTSGGVSSDERLKENIVEMEPVLDKLDQIRAVRFDWNELHQRMNRSTPGRQIGIIAQEIENIFPELITLWNLDEGDCNVLDISPHWEYRAVDYTRFTAVLLQGIKELHTENKNLKNRIETIERQLAI